MTQENAKKSKLNEDGGCAVDWSWIEGRQIASVRSNLTDLVITFTDGQTLRITAQTWQGSPWLSFTPWRDPEAK